jgi:hypothetical protein
MLPLLDGRTYANAKLERLVTITLLTDECYQKLTFAMGPFLITQ